MAAIKADPWNADFDTNINLQMNCSAAIAETLPQSHARQDGALRDEDWPGAGARWHARAKAVDRVHRANILETNIHQDRLSP